ncbi:MAG: uncharacterized protein H6R10_3325 [Rhodocyclaceae bacterium]|nr:uncharacterized protein [Rhodocyclaceae bacterium]
MIKILSAEYLGGHQIRFQFSDDTHGTFDAAALVAKDGSLLQPLRDQDYFRGFFLELGALCWKNGLELSPSALHDELAAAGLLKTSLKAA